MTGRPYRLDAEGARMLTGFEAMILHRYQDVAGVATVCVGHVIRPEDEVWLRDGVTRDECLAVLSRDVGRFEDAINRLVTVPLSQPMVNALVSLVFNIGEAGFAGSTVLRELNQGNYLAASDAFTLWRYATVVLEDGSTERRPVLLGRRESEARLFRSGVVEMWGARYSDPPELAVLLERARAAQFDLREGVRWRPELPGEAPPAPPKRTEDERLVCLPPDREDEAA